MTINASTNTNIPDMYKTYSDEVIDYGYPGNKPLVRPTVTWYYGNTVTVNFDLTDLAPDKTPPIDPSFLLHKKFIVDFYNFRMEHLKSYEFSYDKNEITITTTSISIQLVINNADSHDIFKRGIYYCGIDMDTSLVGVESCKQTVMPVDSYTFNVK